MILAILILTVFNTFALTAMWFAGWRFVGKILQVFRPMMGGAMGMGQGRK